MDKNQEIKDLCGKITYSCFTYHQDDLINNIRAIVRAEIINALPDVEVFVDKTFIAVKSERSTAIKAYLNKAKLN